MTTDSIISSIKEVYRNLDKHLGSIAAKTGMNCPKNCSTCCDKKDIEASPIEYYPLAELLYQTGKADEFLERLDANEGNRYCILYSPDEGLRKEGACEYYAYRGLICRMFGYGYRMNREMIPDLITCKTLKDSLPFAITKAKHLGKIAPDEMPIVSNYFMQLYSIEPDMAVKRFPVNDAIRAAIENLYFHFYTNRE
jgi:uncharacterized protein